MHRFKMETLRDIESGQCVELDRDEKHHLFKILRANVGDRVGLLDGKGISAEAEVLPGKQLQILEKNQFEKPSFRLHLYVASPRKQKMDQLLKQSVELGVWRIVPMISERSVAEPDDASVAGRWTDLLFEACKQSGNPFLPELGRVVKFKEAVCDASVVCGKKFYGSPRACPATDLFSFESSDVAFFVGPEGGFSSGEETQMEQCAFLPLRIGSWTLRVETAAIAGIALLQSMATMKKSSDF